jgi:hypothetical protein
MINALITHIYTAAQAIARFAWSAGLAGGFIYGIFYLSYMYQGPSIAFIAALIASLVVLFSALHNRLTIAAYGRASAALCSLGALLYLGYEFYGLLHLHQFFYALVGLSIGLGFAALWLDRFIFALCATILAMTAPALMLGIFSPTMLGAYFVLALFATVLLAYSSGWNLLALLSFVIYLCYHPAIFSLVSMTPKKGMLLFDDAFWMLGLIGAIFTLIPWLYNMYNPRQHMVDAMCVVMAGAYSFASMRMILRGQLRFIEQFKLLHIFTTPPKYINLLMYLFFIYAAVYATLFVIGKITHRRSGLQNVILMLALISFVGGVAVLNRTHKIIGHVAQQTSIWIKKVPFIRSLVTQDKSF